MEMERVNNIYYVNIFPFFHLSCNVLKSEIKYIFRTYYIFTQGKFECVARSTNKFHGSIILIIRMCVTF